MVLEGVACKHCGLTQQVQRFGKTRSGTQRYRCGDCQRTFVAFDTHKACDPVVQAQLIQMAINGAGVRDTARVLRISRNTVSNQLKKRQQVIQVNPKYAHQGLIISLKVDEMWSFMGSKQGQRWL
ncbi:MAG TPA: IS1 family transposase [Spirosoma sp.]|jgi:transposase-like protein|nr:IS1 family transposase [Spirosoma sp.]